MSSPREAKKGLQRVEHGDVASADRAHYLHEKVGRSHSATLTHRHQRICFSNFGTRSSPTPCQPASATSPPHGSYRLPGLHQNGRASPITRLLTLVVVSDNAIPAGESSCIRSFNSSQCVSDSEFESSGETWKHLYPLGSKLQPKEYCRCELHDWLNRADTRSA
jgi:hypothetical protein